MFINISTLYNTPLLFYRKGKHKKTEYGQSSEQTLLLNVSKITEVRKKGISRKISAPVLSYPAIIEKVPVPEFNLDGIEFIDEEGDEALDCNQRYKCFNNLIITLIF